LGAGVTAAQDSHNSASPIQASLDREGVPGTTGISQAGGTHRQYQAGTVTGARGWSRGLGRAQISTPPPLLQAGTPPPGTPKGPLLGAAWHSPVRDTLGPFSCRPSWVRSVERKGQYGLEEGASAGCTHSCPIRFPEFYSHANCPAAEADKGLAWLPGKPKGKGAVSRDLGSVGLMQNSGWRSPWVLRPGASPHVHLSGRSSPVLGYLGLHLSRSRVWVLTMGHLDSHRGRAIGAGRAGLGQGCLSHPLPRFLTLDSSFTPNLSLSESRLSSVSCDQSCNKRKHNLCAGLGPCFPCPRNSVPVAGTT
jgi:hypothetical protein